MEIANDASLQRQLDQLSAIERELLAESVMGVGCREQLVIPSGTRP